jgi:prepilin-type N-terminal cleavage/methylation domain-containing protein
MKSVAGRGFTLIELLVVISIIATLSSVVLASVATARTNALATRVTVDVKNLETAMNVYFSERGYYPDELPPPPAYVNWPYRYSETAPTGFPMFPPYDTLNAGLVPTHIGQITDAISSTYNSEVTYCPERCMRAIPTVNTWYCGDRQLKYYYISFNYSKGKGTLGLPKFKYQLSSGPITETTSYCIGA